uniref:KIB1-4 beta-propeller domain-containing protein n=1 Tax=Aegilops tauschii TaxID=37682 RepID=M8BP59_AEGTA
MACPCVHHGCGDARGPVVSKIVFSQPPTSEGFIMATMTENHGIMLSRVGCPVVVINRWWGYPNPFFRMFKLINTNTWSEVTMLRDHALFLGPTFSKAVNVPTGRHGNIERNHIYYSNGLSRSSEAHGDEVFLKISNNDGDLKYNINHRKIIADNYKITSVGYFLEDGFHDSMWLLPPDI